MSRHLQLALENTFPVGGVEIFKVFTAETEAVYRTAGCGQRQDGSHPAVLVAYLNTQASRNVKIAVRVHRQVFRAAVVGNVRHVQPLERLIVSKGATGLDHIAIDPLRAVLRREAKGAIR